MTDSESPEIHINTKESEHITPEVHVKTSAPQVSTWVDGQEPRWWTLKEAAALYGVSVKTIRRRINAGTVVAQRDENDPQAPYMVREDSLTGQFGPPKEIPAEKPVELQPPAAIELKSLIDDHRRMLHDLQDAYKAEAIASAKAEHLSERVIEIRTEAILLGERVLEIRTKRDEIKGERDLLRDERDRLNAEVAALRNRRWWQRKVKT
jgi:hypothetical protein